MNTSRQRRLKSLQARRILPVALVLLLLLLAVGPLKARQVHVSGQLSVWGQVDPDESSEAGIGLRYIPEIAAYRQLSPEWELGFEGALILYGYELSREPGSNDLDGDLYRLWLRLASARLEIRGGLQKISFGPAVILRPLMWFDTLDPRDPLGVTRGVYGILCRYYFPGNANLWLWGLYGNDEIRGLQSLPSDVDEIEYGGRYQFPLMSGEMALSYHHRKVAPGKTCPGLMPFTEESFGLDGKWDVGIGLWFEGCLTHRQWDREDPPYMRMLTVGADTTLDVGNGLHVLVEHLFVTEAEGTFASGESAAYSALAADYPLNIFDSLYAILTYDHDNEELSSFLQWQRTYDRWQLYLNLFHSPGGNGPLRDREGGYETMTGDGVQILVVFNH